MKKRYNINKWEHTIQVERCDQRMGDFDWLFGWQKEYHSTMEDVKYCNFFTPSTLMVVIVHHHEDLFNT